MANSSSSAALQFSNLLKQSKALHLTPDVVITSQAGYLHRNDYGLKRPLPASLKRTPYVRVRQMDSKHGQTDFVSAAKEGLFVRRWDEQLAGLTNNRKENEPFFVTSSPFDSQQPLKNPTQAKEELAPSPVQSDPVDAEAAIEEGEEAIIFSRPISDGPMPDYMSMSETEFSSYLDELRSLQSEYRDYLSQLWRSKKQRELKQSSPAQEASIRAEIEAGFTDDMYEHALTSRTTNGELVIDFLRSPAGTAALQKTKAKKAARLQSSSAAELKSTIASSQHATAGLSYIPQDDFYSAYQAPPIPARILHIAPNTTANSRNRTVSSQMTVSALGLSAAVNVGRSRGLGETQFHPENGVRNDKLGRGFARILEAGMDERTFDGSDDMHKKVYVWEVSREDEGVARIPGIELDFKAVEGNGTVMGSREWVYQGEAARPQKQKQRKVLDDDVFGGLNLDKSRQPSKSELRQRRIKEDAQRRRWDRDERDTDVVGSI